MSRGLTVATRPQVIAFWAGFGSFAGVALYDLYWFWIDTLARLGILPEGVVDFDIYGWLATMPLGSNLFFYANLACKILGLGLLALRTRLSVYVIGLSVLFHVIDWVGLSGNAYYDGSLDGTISMAVQLLGMIPLIYLFSAQGLRETR